MYNKKSCKKNIRKKIKSVQLNWSKINFIASSQIIRYNILKTKFMRKAADVEVDIFLS